MRLIFWLCIIFIAAWLTGLALFIAALPTAATPVDVHTDAIVVLTGGSGRVDRGLFVLGEGAASILLVSGVGHEVTLGEMLAAHASQEVRDAIHARNAAIALDYVADTTETNAREGAQFVRDHHYTSIRLITATYHMPRALAEFRGALPGVKVIPDAVFPASFQRDAWWKQPNTRRLVFSEYHKTIAVYLRRVFPWLTRS